MAEWQAGRETDAEVARRVFGQADVRYSYLVASGMEWVTVNERGFADIVPHYSTDIAAAWLVVEAARARGVNVEIVACGGESLVEVDVRAMKDGRQLATGAADTVSLAIVRAALLTTEAGAETRGGHDE